MVADLILAILITRIGLLVAAGVSVKIGTMAAQPTWEIKVKEEVEGLVAQMVKPILVEAAVLVVLAAVA